MIPSGRQKNHKTSRKRPDCFWLLLLYNKHMQLRKPFAALCASLLVVTLFGFGLSWSVWHVLGQPNYIKQALRQSGIYQTAVQDVLKQKQAEPANGTAETNLPVDNPQLQALIKQAFPPQTLQTQTERQLCLAAGQISQFDCHRRPDDRQATAGRRHRPIRKATLKLIAGLRARPANAQRRY
jgi:hypothetical protein